MQSYNHLSVWGNLKAEDADANGKFQTEDIQLEVKHLLSVEKHSDLSDSTVLFNIQGSTFGGKIAVFVNKLNAYT